MPRFRTALAVFCWFPICILAMKCIPTVGDDLINDGDRIVFIGDSNTYAGNFVADIDALVKTSSKKDIEIINVGLPSETCCGLSEPDHPFPRPTVQERTDRVLEKLKPNVVVACYGMNDGIYHPFSEKRFAKYKAGIIELSQKVRKSGAKFILLTPPPFDPLPMRKKKKLVGKDSKQFAWFLIYEDYDSVLKKYSDWILKTGMNADAIIDIRKPILEFQAKERMKDPEFTMSGDGVHFDPTCHRIIANTIIERLIPGEKLKVAAPVSMMTHRKMIILRDAWVTAIGHKRPNVKKGVPVEEANRKVKEIDFRIRLMLKKFEK